MYASGDPSVSGPQRRRDSCGLLLWAVAAGLSVWVVAVPALRAQPSAVVVTRSQESPERSATRDSLRLEIRRHAKVVAGLRDSLSGLEGSASERRRQKETIEQTIAEVGASIDALYEEIAALDVQITDNAISIRDSDGGVISIDIPENFGERISQGISAITELILEELPDSLDVRAPRLELGAPDAPSRPPGVTTHRLPEARDRASRAYRLFQRQSEPARVIEGDLIKVRDDVMVRHDEVVRGNVVAIMSNVLVEGRVDGDLIVVLGDIQLGENAEVGGQIVSVLGRCERPEGAEVGSVITIDPGSFLDLDATSFGVDGGGWASFLVWQSLFLLLALLVLLILAFLPAPRLAAIQTKLTSRPAECFGLGLLVAVAGHVLLGLVLAVLVLTVIGIPLAFLVLLGVVLLDLVAVAMVSVVVGGRLCRLFNLDCQRAWATALLGLFVIHVPSFLSGLAAASSISPGVSTLLGLIGLSIKALVYLFGLGALFASRLGKRRPEPVPDAVLHPVTT